MKNLKIENCILNIENLLSVSVRVCLCLSVAYVSPAFAQLSSEELRREQIETIEALKGTQDISGGGSKLFGALGRRTGWIFSYGASHSSSYTGGDNGTDRNSSTADSNDHTYDYEFKPFVNVTTLDRKTKGYLRLTSKYTEAKKNSAGIRGNNFIQPTVEMMYWEKSFAAPAGSQVKKKLTIGRQFIQVGRGIAYAQTADGLLYDVSGLANRKGEYKFFFARQNPSDDNIDASSSGSGSTKRFFYGIRGKYQVHPKAKMSLYTVQSSDRNKTESSAKTEAGVTSTIQRHKYQPQYYGIVSEGRLTKDLQYWGEYIMERGKTYDSATAVASQLVGIRASAYTAGLRYYFPGDLKPTLFGEYTNSSGDADAFTSTNSSLGGSSAGSDKRFNPFGGLSQGFALSPTMTNMKVYKLGMSIKPFARSANRMITDLSFQPEYYYYLRQTGSIGAAAADGELSKPRSTTDKVGDEYNVSVSWRLMSDVTYQMKYGYFRPGSAYLDRSAETYLKFKLSLDL